MTGNEYQRLALRTAPPTKAYDMKLLQGCMGMCGESGEAIDLLKKHTFQGHELDKLHMAKELGDVLWYVALSADALGFGLEDIMQMNIDKLTARYPGLCFSSEQSIHRKAGDL